MRRPPYLRYLAGVIRMFSCGGILVRILFMYARTYIHRLSDRIYTKVPNFVMIDAWAWDFEFAYGEEGLMG